MNPVSTVGIGGFATLATLLILTHFVLPTLLNQFGNKPNEVGVCPLAN